MSVVTRGNAVVRRLRGGPWWRASAGTRGGACLWLTTLERLFLGHNLPADGWALRMGPADGWASLWESHGRLQHCLVPEDDRRILQRSNETITRSGRKIAFSSIEFGARRSVAVKSGFLQGVAR